MRLIFRLLPLSRKCYSPGRWIEADTLIKTARHHEHFHLCQIRHREIARRVRLAHIPEEALLGTAEQSPPNVVPNTFKSLLAVEFFSFSRPPIVLIRQLIARRYWAQKVQPHAHLHIAIGIAVGFQGLPASQACKIAKLRPPHNSQARPSFTGLGKLADCFSIPGASIILSTV